MLRVNVRAVPTWTAFNAILVCGLAVAIAGSLAQKHDIFQTRDLVPESYGLALSTIYGSFSVFAAATVLYLLHPIFRKRSFGPTVKLDQSHPVNLRVARIAASMNISNPSVLMDANILNTDCIAYGFIGFRTILVGRGVYRLMIKNPDLFDAMLSHEIAHIKNNDIALTFFTVNIVRVIVAIIYFDLALSFFGLFNIARDGWYKWSALGLSNFKFLSDWSGWIVGNAFQNAMVYVPKTAVILVLLALSHKAFLRTRELYADSTAILSTGEETFCRALQVLIRENGKNTLASALGPFRAHPSLKRRLECAKEPLLLVRPSIENIAIAAMILSLVITSYQNFDTSWLKASNISDMFDFILDRKQNWMLVFFVLFTIPIFSLIAGSTYNSAVYVICTQRGVLYFLYILTRIYIIFAPFFLVGTFISGYSVMFNYSLIRYVDWGDVMFPVALYLSNVIVALFVYPILRRLFTNRRDNPPRLSWMLLIVFLTYRSIDAIASLVLIFSQSGRPSVAGAPITFLFAEVLLCWIGAYLLARGSLSLRPLSTVHLAPWLTEMRASQRR